jgi:hypothetical protein
VAGIQELLAGFSRMRTIGRFPGSPKYFSYIEELTRSENNIHFQTSWQT